MFLLNTERCWIVDSSKNSSDLPSLYFGRTLSAHIEPILKNKQISKEDNFDEEDVVITKCIGGGGVEESWLITFLDLSLNLSLDLLSQKIVQVLDLFNQKIVKVSFIINSIICTCVEVVVEICPKPKLPVHFKTWRKKQTEIHLFKDFWTVRCILRGCSLSCQEVYCIHREKSTNFSFWDAYI